MIKSKSGQALVTLLVFSAVAIIIASAATVVTIINARSTGTFAQTESTLAIAEAGADNAILQILRNPNYVSETVNIGDGTATITASGTTTKTIISEGKIGNLRRKIEVTGTYNNTVFAISSWSEVD